MPKIRSGNVSSHTKGYITSAKSAIGQHRTKRMHHKKKAAMATSFVSSSSQRPALSQPPPFTYTTTEKAEKFRSLCTRSAEAVLRRTKESPHLAAYGNHRSQSKAHGPKHE